MVTKRDAMEEIESKDGRDRMWSKPLTVQERAVPLAGLTSRGSVSSTERRMNWNEREEKGTEEDGRRGMKGRVLARGARGGGNGVYGVEGV